MAEQHVDRARPSPGGSAGLTTGGSTSSPLGLAEGWQRASRQHFAQVAPRYDAGRTFKKGRFWADAISARVSLSATDRLLEVGCGTGRCTLAFAERFPGFVVGVDPAAAMLTQARTRAVAGEGDRRAGWALGVGETLSFLDGAFRVVFMSQVWHHLADETRAAAEFSRVLAPGGSLFVNTFSHTQIRDRWELGIFPELLPFMLHIYPALPRLVCTLSRAGLVDVAHTTFHQAGEQRPSELLAIAEGRLWSMFAYLSEAGRQTGLARLRRLIAETDDAPVPRPTSQLLVHARKPEASRDSKGGETRV